MPRNLAQVTVKRSLYVGFILAAVFVFLYLLSRDNYLIFHSTVELFAVVIALSVFLLSWNARAIVKNDYFLFIAIAFLATGVLTLLHLLTYEGMNLVPDITADIPTELWVATRYLLAISFLIAPIFLRRQLNQPMTLLIYLLGIVFIFLSIFYWKIFPVSYIDGQGLTAFKIISEYAIIVFFAVSGFLLYRNRDRFDWNVYLFLLISIVLNIVTELFFTLYVGVYDFTNFLGHVFEVLAYFFAYKAIIEFGLTKPYNLMFFELHNADKRKNDYVRFLGHELKTPITSIKLYAELLAGDFADRDDKSGLEAAERIGEQANAMTRIINDLLDAGRIESGRIELNSAPVEIDKLVGNIVADFRLLHSSRQFKLVGKSGKKVLADSERVRQILINLLNNANKYSPSDKEVIVGIREQAGKIRIEIKDFGAGIPLKHQSVIFDKYYRLDDGKHGPDGLGIGLFLSRSLARLQGGDVGVESVVGQGSTFYFTLPVVEV